MSPDQASEILKSISEVSPGLYSQIMSTADAALNARPGFIKRQAPKKRANMIRRTLARTSSNDFAEEILATYFLESHKDSLVEWLDLLDLKHQEGLLSEDMPASPSENQLDRAVNSFRQKQWNSDRELLLYTFAAQRAIEWPDLNAILESL